MKYNRKKGTVVKACACATVMIGAVAILPFPVKAVSLSALPMDTALAGFSVPQNNYYASRLEPEKELKTFLESIPESPSEAAQESYSEESVASETDASGGDQEESEETTEISGELVSGIAGVKSPAFTAAETEAPATEAETSAPEPEPSPYDNIAITRVTNYVNIRDAATTEGEIVGKIYNNAAATILETVDGEDGEWYYIKSGKVKGYMKAEFFVTGAEAESIARDVGTVLAKTTAITLNLRAEPTTQAKILTQLAQGEIYAVREEGIVNEAGESFIEILVNAGETESDSLIGYISSDYADVYVEFEEAISREEEEAELARIQKLKEEEEAAKERIAEEEKKKAEESKKAAQTTKAAETSAAAPTESSGAASTTQAAETTAQATTKAPETAAPASSGNGAVRDAICARAQQFVGNLAYVSGGTSLSSGVDCSGFTSAIFREYGISIPRDSRSQAASSVSVSRGDLLPGDLVFYANSSGTINHVAIYIGGGKIVHAANSATGVRISSVDYATPARYGRYIQ